MLMSLLLKTKLKAPTSLLFAKTIIFVLDVLMANLFALSQVPKCWSSLFMNEPTSCKLCPLASALVSSAKRKVANKLELGNKN